MYHEEWGVASRLASGGAVGPKGKGGNHGPAGVVAVACLEDGLADSVVLSLDDAVRLGVVCRNADVTNAIPFR